MLKLHWNDQTI